MTRQVIPLPPREIVWSPSLTNGRVIVHAVLQGAMSLRAVPKRSAQWRGDGTRGRPTRCGRNWVLTALSSGEGHTDFRYPGLHMYSAQADALGAHYCQWCFGPQQQTIGAAA